MRQSTASKGENINMKRLFSKTSDKDCVYDELDCKRQKFVKHSVEDVNVATIEISDGYMTRNRLKKLSKKDSKNNCNGNIETSNESVKGKSNKQRSKTVKVQTPKRKLQQGYVFTQDIFPTYLDKNTNKKYTHSLFESDSEPEVNSYQLKTSAKSEIEKKETLNIPETEFTHSASNKNPVKTYFNKKSCLLDHKSTITNTKLDNFEKQNGEIINCATEPLLKQLTKGLQMENSLQDKSKSHELCSKINAEKSIVFDIEEKKSVEVQNSEILSENEILDCDVSANLSNEILELTNLLTYELENMNSVKQTNTDDVICSNKILNSSSCNDPLLKNDAKIDDCLDKFKLPFDSICMLKSSSSSIFDVPQEKALVESYIDLKQNTFKESSIFYGPKKTDTTSKEITVINNFTSIEFNNSQPGILQNNLLNTFDEPKDKVFKESYTSIKQNSLSESSIFYIDSEKSNDDSKDKPELNNLTSYEFNNRNLVNQKHIYTVDDNTIDDIPCYEKLFSSSCNDSSFKQDTDINVLVKQNPSSIIENDLLSIFDKPNKKSSINENLPFFYEADNDVSKVMDVINNSQTEKSCNDFTSDNNKDSNKLVESEKSPLKTIDKLVENHVIDRQNESKEEEKNYFILKNNINSNLTSNQYFPTVLKHKKKRKSVTCISEIINDDSTENDNLKFEIKNSSEKSSQRDSKCSCEIFYSFNKDTNKILTSKIKHFAFNINAKKVRQKLLDQKNLEASLLKLLISNDMAYNLKMNSVQSKNHLSILKPVPINSKHKKCVNPEKNDHIEPTILNILKDVYVGVDFLSGCDYNEDDTELPIQQSICKNTNFNVQPTKRKQINSPHLIINNNETVPSNENIYKDKIDVNFDQKKKIKKFNDTSKGITVINNFTTNEFNNRRPGALHNDMSSICDEPKEKMLIECYTSTKLNNLSESSICYVDSEKSNDSSKDKPELNNLTSYEFKNRNSVNQKRIYKIDDNTIDDIPCNKKLFLSNCNDSLFKQDTDIELVKPKLSTENGISEEIDTTNNLLRETNCNDPLSDKSINSNELVKSEKMPLKTIDFIEQNTSIKINSFNVKSVFESCEINSNFGIKNEIKLKENNYDDNNITVPKLEIKASPGQSDNPTNLTTENNNFNEECKKPLTSTKNDSENINILPDKIETYCEFAQLKEVQFLKNETEHITDSKLSHVFESPSKSLFDLSNHNMEYSLDYSSDDDDYKLLINDEENFDCVVNNSSLVSNSLFDNSTNTITTSSSSLSTNILKNPTVNTELNENSKIFIAKSIKPSSVVDTNQDHTVLKPDLLEKEAKLFTNQHLNLCESDKEQKKTLENCFFISVEVCNNYYEKKTLKKEILNGKNEHFPKNIDNIFTEMFVYDMFVPLCQHMVDFCDDDELKTNNLNFQTDNYSVNKIPEKVICDVKTKNGLSQSIPTNAKITCKQEIVKCTNENNTPSKSIIETKHFHSPQKSKEIMQSCLINTEEAAFEREIMNNKPRMSEKNVQKSDSQNKDRAKSNIKVRTHLRKIITSDKTLNEVLESKDFRNLRLFHEEEIANSIGVFLFEQTIDSPTITGLPIYKESYDHSNDEEKYKLLRSTELRIICPKIIKLTSITLALKKMLRSDSLIELILNVIRRNVLNKKMNTDHSIDHQLMKFIAYFVDICARLGLLKTLQTFIFDSMVFIPNKYCCVIFISLLLWKTCLPVSVNYEQDPVIITALSYLIAKKKYYSEQNVGGCDIFQRELINLLSVYFNYSFSLELPANLIYHVHKPDFFISVAMILKCAHPADLVEFIDKGLFPIIEDYLNTQHSDINAIKIMELISMIIKPFKMSCNTIVATFLNKCKTSIEGMKKNKKEHIYNIQYNCYKIMQNKFISYLNDNRSRSQSFEELLVSIIMVLGSVEYISSCVTLMKWKPKFKPSTILSQKLYMFKSILGHVVWDKLSVMDDPTIVRNLINSYMFGKNEFNTIERIHALQWKLKKNIN